MDGEWKTFTHDTDSFDLRKHEITSVKYDDILECDSCL